MPRDLSRSPPRRPSPSPLRRGPGLRERVPSRSRSPYRPSYSDGDYLFYVILSCSYFVLTMATFILQKEGPSPSSPRRRRVHPHQKPLQRKRSPSVTGSPVAKSSPHLGSTENKNAVDKQRLEEEKKRRQKEVELRLLEEETTKRVEQAIRKQVEDSLNSEEIKHEIQRRIDEGRKRIYEEVVAQIEKEKVSALVEAQQRAPWSSSKELERYQELERLQKEREEAMKQKQMEEQQQKQNQMKLLGKNKTRPKLSFSLGMK
ncbi:hypothetical protein ZWY2020_006853 [Hordeum vulgare]|nr:hypothetical protein ZWY2020_006853 [Hordeum vulgare]